MSTNRSIFNLPCGVPTKETDIEGIIDVPVLFFDSVDASGFASDHDGANQYAGNPHSLEFFGILALGYLRNYPRKHSIPDSLFLDAEKYLESFLCANDAYRHRGYMESTYYAFIPGKLGGRLVLHLAEGSRRFGASYILSLINYTPLRIPCKMKISQLDEGIAELKINELRRKLKHAKGIKNRLLRKIKKIKKHLHPIFYYDSDDYDYIGLYSENFSFLEGALAFQRYINPVLEDLISIIKAENIDEEAFIRIFQRINKAETSGILSWLRK